MSDVPNPLAYVVFRMSDEGVAWITSEEGARFTAAVRMQERNAAAAEITALRARVAELEGALEYYADPRTYERFPTTVTVDGPRPIGMDAGYTARAALKTGE